MKIKPAIPKELHPLMRDVEAILKKFNIDFYLVGAVARDYHLSANEDTRASRITADVDLAIMLNDAGEFNTLKEAMLKSGKFTADPEEHIKLYYKLGQEVDLIPFGKIEKPNGMVFLEKPNLFSLSMAGFKEIYPFANYTTNEKGLSFKVCSVEGLIILKLMSYRDKPERTKDITDIEHIFEVYFDLCEENIYDEHFDLMDKYHQKEARYFSQISARVIGRKMKKILDTSDELKQKVTEVLKKRYDDWAEALLEGINDIKNK